MYETLPLRLRDSLDSNEYRANTHLLTYLGYTIVEYFYNSDCNVQTLYKKNT